MYKITSESLLYRKGDSTQCSVVTYVGRKSEKEGIDVCVCVCVCIADSFFCTAETNNIVKQLYSNKYN